MLASCLWETRIQEVCGLPAGLNLWRIHCGYLLMRSVRSLRTVSMGCLLSYLVPPVSPSLQAFMGFASMAWATHGYLLQQAHSGQWAPTRMSISIQT